jgi:hypothetical protein
VTSAVAPTSRWQQEARKAPSKVDVISTSKPVASVRLVGGSWTFLSTLTRAYWGFHLKRLLGLLLTAAVIATALVVLSQGRSTATVSVVPGSPVNVQTFPVAGGIGVRWQAPPMDGFGEVQSYRVQRQRSNETWGDASGDVDTGTTSWIDTRLAAGDTASYRVIAGNSEGEGAPSASVTGTRPTTDPVAGDVNALTVDTDLGGAPTGLAAEVASPVTVGPADGDARTLTAGDIRLTIPATLAGRRSWSVGIEHMPLGVQQGATSCGDKLTGILRIEEVLYTANLQIATMAGYYTVVCNGALIGGEIRINSTRTYSAVELSAYQVDFGQVRLDSTVEHALTLTNTGTSEVWLSSIAPTISGDDSYQWRFGTSQCLTLAPGASCTLRVGYAPQDTVGVKRAVIRYSDSTPLGTRHIHLTAKVVSVPSAPVGAKARPTLTGVDLSWERPNSNGALPLTEYVIRRVANGQESIHRVPATQTYWSDTELTDRYVEYYLSAVNELGMGNPTGPIRLDPNGARDQLTIFTGRRGEPARLSALSTTAATHPVSIGSDPITADGAQLTTSPDGHTAAYTDGSTLWKVQVDRTGAEPERIFEAADIRSPAWSPDGTRLAFVTTDGQGQPCVNLVATTGGDAVLVGCGLDYPAWHLDAHTLLVRDNRVSGAPLALVRAQANGARVGVISGSNGATKTTVSASGRVAFVPDSTPRRIALLQLPGGTPVLSREFSAPVSRISWAPHGGELVVLTRSDDRDSIWRWRGMTDPFTGEPTFDDGYGYATGPTDYIADVVWQGYNVVIKPSPPVFGPTATFDIDASGISNPSGAICAINLGPYSLCGQQYSYRLPSGTHLLRVLTDKGTRPHIAARMFIVDATAPAPTITGPTFATTTAPTATVTYTATDTSGVASYDVRYRVAGASGTFGTYAYPLSGTRATSLTLKLNPGYEHCTSVRAKDAFGNLSGWSAERCFSRPLDDRGLAASTGWIRGTASTSYLGTSTYTTKYGVSLARGVQAKRVYLLATKCSNCGIVSVYLGSRYIGAVNLYAATTQRQVLIALPAQSSVFVGTLRITSRSTGKLIQIDGVAVRRT